MSTVLSVAAGKTAAKKPSAKRHAAKKSVLGSPEDSIAEQLLAVRERISTVLSAAFSDAVTVGFGEQYDHDWHTTRPAIIVRYTIGKDASLTTAQLTARRKMLAAWHDARYTFVRSVFALDELFM
jgi:hypothetical protein